MTEFKNVSIVKKANIYFDGNVTSRTIVFSDGSRKTLGIMLPGEYEFNTGDREIIEIISGDLTVSLPGEDNWKVMTNGSAFEVPANSKFRLRIETVTDYCCSFVD